MTREEIRMKIYKLLWRVAEHKTFPSDALVELNELVVIKVERELPYDWYNDAGNKLMIEEEFSKAGYVAVEPLI